MVDQRFDELRRLGLTNESAEPTAAELAAASRPSFRISSPGGRRPQRGGGEAIDALASSLLATVPAGVATIGALPGGAQKAAKAGRRVQDALTIDPQTEGGVQALRGIAGALAPLGAAGEWIGDKVFEATGSPGAAFTAQMVLDPLNAAGLVAAKPALAAAGRGAAAAGRATAQSLGPKAAEMAEAYMRRAGMMPDITVYHGSPHTFAPEEGAPLGRFRSEKIGTGEGNQTYGHGLYLAEEPAVATGYRERLTGKNPNVFRLGDKDVSIVGGSPEWKKFSEAAKGQGYSQESAALAYQTLKDKKGNLDAASGELTWMDDATKIHDDAASLLRGMQYKPEGGGLYTVDLPDPIVDKMLDWDKPLGQQSPDVQKAAQRIAANLDPDARKLVGDSLMSLKGSKLYELLASDDSVAGAGRFGAAASAIMREHGIPGIKYLDEGSRSNFRVQNKYKGENYGTPVSFKTEEQALNYMKEMKEKGWLDTEMLPGTRNFVVFPGEEKSLAILQRNEQRLPQVDTPAFRGFTGGAPFVKADQASKHQFETGQPVVIEGYHGTRRDFSAVDPAQSSAGYFASSKPVVAEEYAGVYPEGMGGGSFPTGGNIQKTYIRMDNPLVVNARGASFNRVDTRGIPGFGLPMSSTDMINYWAKQQGYDGVIYKDLRDSVARPRGQNTPASNVYVAFKPNYVKSAIGNRGTFDIGTTDMTKAQGGAVGGNMSYTQAADVIADKLIRQGMDPDRAFMMALRMSDARMKAGGAVLMADGGDAGDAEYEARIQEDMRRFKLERAAEEAAESAAQLQASREQYREMDRGARAAVLAGGPPTPPWTTVQDQERNAAATVARIAEQRRNEQAQSVQRMRKTWDGPMPNRPVVNGRAMVSAEELADFRRKFGASMTLTDLLNADQGRGPSGAMPAARGVQGANIKPAGPRVRPDEAATLPPVGLRDVPGLIMQGMQQGAQRVPAGRGAGAAFVGAALPRLLVPTAKTLRDHPSITPEQRQWLKEFEDYINVLNKERVDPPEFGAGGEVAKGMFRTAERSSARLAAKKAAEEAAKGVAGAAFAAPGIPQVSVAPAAIDLTGALRPATQPVRGKTSQELRALQRQQLTPQQQEVLHKLKQQYPDFAESSKFMTPQELSKVIARPDSVAAMDRLLQALPSSKNLSAVAKAGDPKRGWYRASTQAIIDVFGLQDAPRFSALLAAMSPQTSVEMNLLNTLNTWKNWTAAGRPTDPATIRKVMGQSVAGTKGEGSVLGAWEGNAIRALSADDPTKVVLSGPKVDSFYRNLADDVYRVTNDAWMANIMGVGQDLFSGSPTALQLQRGDPGLSPGYIGTSARIRQAGQEAGILPSEAQETIWSFAMPAMEMQGQTGLPAREILQRGLLTPERIRGTPDFATLLGEGKYGDILKQAGYEEQLSRLKPTEFSARGPDLTLSEQRQVEEAAKRLEDLKGLRGAESRSRSISLPSQGQPPRTAFAVEPHEYIPGAGVRLGESMVTAPLGRREHYSSEISSLFKDLQGRDRLQQAVGLNPLPTRSGTGAFRPGGGIPYQGTVREEATTQRMPVESQPAFAAVTEVPVVRGGLDIAQKAKERLGAAAATRGYLTGQHGSTYNVHIPRQGGESFMVKMEGKAGQDPMRYAYQYLDDAGFLADTGAGVNVLMNKYKPGNVPFSPSEAVDIENILGGKGIVPGVNVSDYIDYSPAWMGPEGSGKATRELLDRIEPLSKAEKAALSQETQDIAGGLYDLFTRKSASTGDEYRLDVMRALEILRDKGLPGLAAALSSGAALPSEQPAGR